MNYSSTKIFYILSILSYVNATNTTNININKIIFSPETYVYDIITLTVILIISILSTLSGVSGGSIFVPLFMLINKFNIQEAIPLSISTVLGSSFIRFLYFFNKFHQNVPYRNLIYYPPIFIITTSITSVAFIGSIMVQILPKLILFIVILLFLGYSFVITFFNGIRKTRKFIQSNNNIVEEFSINKIKDYNYRQIHPRAKDSILRNIISTLIIVAVISLASILSFCRSLFNNCSWEFIFLSILQIIVIESICIVFCILVKIDSRNRIKNNYLVTDSDIIFTFGVFIKIIIIGSITGIFATYIGIGGGSFIVPLLIHLGMSPLSVVATGSVISFYTSLISTIIYLIEMRIMWIYALVYNIPGIIGTIIGIIILRVIKRKFLFITIFMASFIILASIIVLIVNLIVNNGISIFTDINIGNFC
jgi:uncharacterized membrane protein YfcA